ncbi:unnamed protein product, partial [Ostreobium quekettii]
EGACGDWEALPAPLLDSVKAALERDEAFEGTRGSVQNMRMVNRHWNQCANAPVAELCIRNHDPTCQSIPSTWQVGQLPVGTWESTIAIVVEKFPGVERLQLKSTVPMTALQLSQLRGIYHLRNLCLTLPSIGDHHLEALRALPLTDLKVVRTNAQFGNNNIVRTTDAGMACLRALTKLTFISLTNLKDAAECPGFSFLSSLTALCSVGLVTPCIDNISFLLALIALSSLRLVFNDAAQGTHSACSPLNMLTSITSLVELECWHCAPCRGEMAGITTMSALTTLAKLRLCKCTASVV